jgi:hypothetical protein
MPVGTDIRRRRPLPSGRNLTPHEGRAAGTLAD